MATLDVTNHIADVVEMQAEIKATYVEAMGDALVAADRKGLIVFFNPAAVKLFGYHPVEVLGKPLTILLPERFREIHDQHMDFFWADPQPREMGSDRRIFLLTKDGAEIEATASITPMWLRQGRVAATAIRKLAKARPKEPKDSIGG